MLTNPSPEEQAVLEQTLRRPRSTLTTRERVAEALLSLGFGGAVAVLWVSSPSQHLDLAPGIISVLVLIFAVLDPHRHAVRLHRADAAGVRPAAVRAAPSAVVPLAVVLAEAVVAAAGRPRGRACGPSRLVHAIRERLVRRSARSRSSPLARTTPACAGAGPARRGARGAVHRRLRRRPGFATRSRAAPPFAEQLRDAWVYVVDAALSGVALRRRRADPSLARSPRSHRCRCSGLSALFARERRQRLESLLELNRPTAGRATRRSRPRT